ncbi:MAG: hypothetical protein MJZ05_08530 [Fibrobacter sp.]|nr:hypothetical protein [Fibrobacter sp.]
MSKFLTSLALSACLASFAFAQEDEYENSYSSAEESSYEAAPAEEAEDESSYNDAAPMKAAAEDDEAEDVASEAQWTVNVHPITTLFLTAFGAPSIYMTVEKVFHQNLSIIGRPFFLYMSAEDDDVEASIWEFGLMGGARWYFNPGHRGFYADALLTYTHASLSGSDRYETVEASVNGVGIEVLAGWKGVSGAWSFGADVGLGFMLAAASGSSSSAESSIESAASSGVVFDLDIYVGYSF